ncbi:hypothetical protein KSP39_PZI023510 [Platanthera zijinensis]|uniref:Uncharacterized protein n=1 Tax=Platanthera zijinensis TaxID=2320716 RepID=A0AAP0ASD4_9ASPA
MKEERKERDLLGLRRKETGRTPDFDKEERSVRASAASVQCGCERGKCAISAPRPSMAYVDHAFSISDEDIMMESSYMVHKHPPVKEITIALLAFDVIGIVLEIVMTYNRAGGDCAHVRNKGFSSRSWGRKSSWKAFSW